MSNDQTKKTDAEIQKANDDRSNSLNPNNPAHEASEKNKQEQLRQNDASKNEKG